MSSFSTTTNPYQHFEGSKTWALLDHALLELAHNRDLVEKTPHTYIVGYLCQALAASTEAVPSPERRWEALKALQEMVSTSTLRDRDLVGELIAERRAEAARE